MSGDAGSILLLCSGGRWDQVLSENTMLNSILNASSAYTAWGLPSGITMVCPARQIWGVPSMEKRPVPSSSNLLAQGEGRFVGDVFDLIHKSTLLSSVQLSSTRPSVDSVTTCQGRNLPLFFSAVTAACSIPPQQGTSMRTTVRLLIRFWRRISVSFSL